MAVVQEIQRRFRQILTPVVGACLLSYFAYHTVQGDRGLLAYWRLSQEVERGSATLASLVETRSRKEHRVSLLKNNRMDLDLLEERYRDAFNHLHPDDLIIYLPKETP